jgi:hypothetical protein
MSTVIGSFYGNNGKYIIFKQNENSQISSQQEIINSISKGYQYVDNNLFPIGSTEDRKQGDGSQFDGYLLDDIFNIITSVKERERDRNNSLFNLLFISGENEQTDIFFDNSSFISKKNSWKEIVLSNHQEGTSTILSGNPYVISNYFILRDSESTSLNIIGTFTGNNGEYIIIEQDPDNTNTGSQMITYSLSQGYNYISDSLIGNSDTEFDDYLLINIFNKIEQATSVGTINDKDNNPNINTIFIVGETQIKSFYKSDIKETEIINDDSYVSEFKIYNEEDFSTTIGKSSNNYLVMKQPTGRICFLQDTPVITDQGELPIQDITSDNTISGRFVEKVSRIINQDNFMIMIKKDSLDFQVPSQDTLISQHHRVYIGKKGIKAKYLINNDTIYKYKTGHQPIYNVLLEGDKKGKMNVNNLTVETLDRKYLKKIIGNRPCREH